VILLLSLLFMQGPIPPLQPKGFITGVVRTAAGAPAPGVRVFATPVQRDANAVPDASVLEGLASTDQSGRYRIEVPAGRYYVAAGSVNMPTYFPGTTAIATAREIQVTAGSVVESIDFSRFVPAAQGANSIVLARNPVTLPPGSDGDVSGVIRYADGRPAAGITVALVPINISGVALPRIFANLSTTTSPAAVLPGTAVPALPVYYLPPLNVRTDSSGRYRLVSIPPGDYKIVAGYSDSPVYFPGTADFNAAATITTTSTTKLDTVDFALPNRVSTLVSGRVTAVGGGPAVGATIWIKNVSNAAVVTMLPLPQTPPLEQVSADGTFRLSNVLAGTYEVQANLSGASAITRSIVVGDQPLTGVDFDFKVARVSGRVLLEDGTLPDLKALGSVGVATTENPNAILTTVLPYDYSGQFSKSVDAGNYRFHFLTLPDEYRIQSITAGGRDISNGNLSLGRDADVNLEIRVARRTESRSSSDGVRVRGRTVAGGSGRVQLCCFSSGLFERLTAAVGPDGSFEFGSVLPGRYNVELAQASGRPLFLQPVLEVKDRDLENLSFSPDSGIATTGGRVAVVVNLSVEGGTLPPAAAVYVSFLGEGTFGTMASLGSSTPVFVNRGMFRISVSNIPQGFRVREITDGRLIVDPNLPHPISGPSTLNIKLVPDRGLP
jgi:hypothetical protein